MKLDRRSRHTRALAIGIGVSVAIHVVALLVFRFSTALPAPEAERLVTFEPPEPIAIVEEAPAPPVQEADPVDATAPEMDIIGESLEGAAATAAAVPGAAQPTPAEAPLNGDPILPAAEVAETPTLTEPTLAVTEPALAVIAEAAEAETTSEELDENVPVWQPGSVGKAKRQWANNGSGASRRGDGDGVGILIGLGGGHCPMPGRGRGRPALPPSWFD